MLARIVRIVVRIHLNLKDIYVCIQVTRIDNDFCHCMDCFLGERPYQCTICNFRFTQSNR